MNNYTKKGLFLALTGGVLMGLLAFCAPRISNNVSDEKIEAANSVDMVIHSIWDDLAKKHINDEGLVDYKAFKEDVKTLDSYLAMLGENPPKDSWSKDEKMAYWINAYNANTVKLILDYYPVKSIKDIGSKIQVPFVSTPWAKKFIRIGNETMSLDNIEHGTLRKDFDEKRIHFALVCAAMSCPRLRNEAYTAEKLDAQLDEQGQDFINNPAKNRIDPKKAQLSKYFDWYKGDWKDNDKSVMYWVNRYSKTKINKDTDISFLNYNWALNEQK